MIKRKRWKWGILAALLLSVNVSASAVNGNYDRRAMIDEQWHEESTELPMVGTSDNAWKRINGICYNGVGEVIPGVITRGIDVSEWNGEIDWSKVKNSEVDFAFVRISYGTGHLDYQYDYNMREANKAGVPVGTYVYSTATTQEGALAEAQYAIRKMQGYEVSYPVVYDVEYSPMRQLSPTELSMQILVFCNEVRKAGYYPMVYSNVDYYNNVLNMAILSDVDMWLAVYSDKMTGPNKSLYDYTIWQATDGNINSGLVSTRGLVDGIPVSNAVDVNFGYVDYTKIITPRTSSRSDYVPSSTISTGYTGWVTNGDNTYYYRDGQILQGSQYINGVNYYFSNEDGHLYTSTLLTSQSTGNIVYVDDTGAVVTQKWITFQDNTYYFGADGNAYKGHRKVGSYYYYFDSSTGVMYEDYLLRATNGVIYYFDSQGRRVTNSFRTITDEKNNYTGKYFFDKTGRAYKGWHIIRGRKYYFYPGRGYKSGTMAVDVTLKIGRYLYTFNSYGRVLEKVLYQNN